MGGAEVISGSNLHLLYSSCHHQTIFSASHLAYSNISNPIRLKRKYPYGSCRLAPPPGRTTVKVSSSFMAATATLTDETFYDLLGVSENGTLSDIKKAYKQMARKYHPDVSPPGNREEYTKRFIMVKEAYDTLSDSRSRTDYDINLTVEGLESFLYSKPRSSSDEYSKNEWRLKWLSQLEELNRKTTAKYSAGKPSWGTDRNGQKSPE